MLEQQPTKRPHRCSLPLVLMLSPACARAVIGTTLTFDDFDASAHLSRPWLRCAEQREGLQHRPLQLDHDLVLAKPVKQRQRRLRLCTQRVEDAREKHERIVRRASRSV
eukprot:6191013-Pleurochrysis_carterae.AAC.4